MKRCGWKNCGAPAVAVAKGGDYCVDHKPGGWEPGFYVDVVAYDGDEVVKRLGPSKSEKRAKRVELGANINLDSDNYYTLIEQVR